MLLKHWDYKATTRRTANYHRLKGKREWTWAIPVNKSTRRHLQVLCWTPATCGQLLSSSGQSWLANAQTPGIIVWLWFQPIESFFFQQSKLYILELLWLCVEAEVGGTAMIIFSTNTCCSCCVVKFSKQDSLSDQFSWLNPSKQCYPSAADGGNGPETVCEDSLSVFYSPIANYYLNRWNGKLLARCGDGPV